MTLGARMMVLGGLCLGFFLGLMASNSVQEDPPTKVDITGGLGPTVEVVSESVVAPPRIRWMPTEKWLCIKGSDGWIKLWLEGPPIISTGGHGCDKSD